MPDFMVSPFDRPVAKKIPPPPNDPDLEGEDFAFPASGWEAIFRGARGQCPRCNDAKLFHRFLKPVATCPRCRQDWTHQQADDFPAYIVILLLGHILVPLMIEVNRALAIPLGVQAALWPCLAVILALLLIQPAKAMVITFQWSRRMDGFA